MKAFTLIEPWASLVAWGFKRVETRSWRSRYRGTIAIHASKNNKVVKDLGYVSTLFEEAGCKIPPSWPRHPEEYPLGKVIAIVKLSDCRKMDQALIDAQTTQERAFGAWAVGRCAWFLEGVRRIPEAIPCRGALSLWELNGEVEAAALARSV